MFRVVGAALPLAAGVVLAGSANGFTREEMPAQIAKLYRERCAADPVHAPTLDAALRCNIVSIPEGTDRPRPDPPSL